MNIEVVKADYQNPQHQKDIPFLLNEYATDPMGAGEPLSQHVRDHLVSELAKLPHAFSIIAYVNDQPAGLANCFEGFSTFACLPLINIHDLCVIPQFRGLGLSQMLLQKVEEIANSKGCCKITLEVLSNNTVAKSAYQKFGFSGYELDPEAGSAVFWQKKLGV
ncbi:GNAT family N-acetyltransferase [Gracilimonas mengyeensis]|uniref:Acetyltransferase (GNAT) family protein n=1 Tax=Gracilimonas mengyeensis TaxID=1302730 RepID=A0A521ESW3_9BACT|nr:GNAT family N-acetyltransferase [Gracilimonas mengyeensis]SMO86972.1 Acetyltransferase (GNAT) family protein [Gracilimonas mengyeensis]